MIVPMSSKKMLDTNILLYSISSNPTESAKRDKALDILRSPMNCLSAQVIQEFYVQATHPTRGSLTHDQAYIVIESLRFMPFQPTTLALIHTAFDIKTRYQISYWDSAIISAAKLLECKVLLSEDLNHGQIYADVQVINPFRD